MRILFAVSLAFFILTLPLRTLGCEDHKKSIETSESAPLPSGSLYHLESKWLDQNGESVKFSELKGAKRVIAMVFTRCETACPVLMQQLKTVRARLGDSSNVKFNVFSFDSERETADSLKTFLQKYKVGGPNWSAFTSNKSGVSELAAALGVKFKRLPSGDFVHANVFFVLNEKGEVLAKHEGLANAPESFFASLH